MTEFAWVIESEDISASMPLYYAGYDEVIAATCWSYNHMEAIRFARKEDAEKMSSRMQQKNNRIAQHGWMIDNEVGT